jgi:GH35 family endo-1,4-beta-xylanase
VVGELDWPSLCSKAWIIPTLTTIRAFQNANVEVIFVHGLDGDAISTWGLGDGESWDKWIYEAAPKVNIRTLRYQLRSSNWKGGD